MVHYKVFYGFAEKNSSLPLARNAADYCVDAEVPPPPRPRV